MTESRGSDDLGRWPLPGIVSSGLNFAAVVVISGGSSLQSEKLEEELPGQMGVKEPGFYSRLFP